MNQSNSNVPTFLFVIIAVVLAGFGLIFLLAAGQGNSTIRLTIGVGCLVAGAAMLYLAKMRPVEHTHIHKMEVDLPGDVAVRSTQCKSCGATIDSGSVKVVAGAIQVTCPYCGTSYELEESPKW